MKKVLGDFLYSVNGGAMVGFGALAYLMNIVYGGTKIIGAVLFCIGLFAILTLGWNLFTGMAGYVFENDLKSYIPKLILVWIGNFVGAVILAYAIRLAYADNVAFWDTVGFTVSAKLAKPYGVSFVLAVMCNFLVVLSVDEYKNNPHVLGKYIGMFFGVVIFVYLGFEHSVANMFYFALAGKLDLQGFASLLTVTLGNVCGGVVIPLSRSFRNYCYKD